MSRSGYNDGCDGWELIRWRGAVASAIRGARGQQLLREMAAALDAMPEKRLIREDLERDGEVCALGCLGRARGIEMTRLDPYEPEPIAKAFAVSPALIREITFINDDWGRHATPEEVWNVVRKWITEHLHQPTTP